MLMLCLQLAIWLGEFESHQPDHFPKAAWWRHHAAFCVYSRHIRQLARFGKNDCLRLDT